VRILILSRGLVAVAIGCGGTEGTSSDGGVAGRLDDAVAADHVSNCAAVAGAPCATPGESCASDSCSACLCGSAGTWICVTRTTECTSCPSSVTESGSCAHEGLTCTQEGFCGAKCTCTQGLWACPSCPGGACGGAACGWVSCPALPPVAGATCPNGLADCAYSYAQSCAEGECRCSGGQWACTYFSDCEDAGSD
jgi:hypothetical protein